MAVYTVKRGDTLSSIAKQHGVATWQELYRAPDNVAFRALRPDPNWIQPGDKIHVPGHVFRSAGEVKPTNRAIGPKTNPEKQAFRLAVIDGTGERDDQDYASAMQHSFCRQMAGQAGRFGHYWRGPAAEGFGLENTAEEAYQWLRGQYNSEHSSDGPLRLILAGYSRGGSAAIMVAERLEKDGIDVDSMFLFDAVARHHYSGGEVIPANVQFSRHARRNLNCQLMVYQYEGSFSDAGLLPNMSNPMRPSFGNTGLTWRGNGDHNSRLFRGTHGALGGVGWSFVVEDPGCQNEVAAWMNQELARRNVPISLTSVPPTGQKPAKPGKVTRIFGNLLNEILLKKHYQNQSSSGKVD